MDALYRMAMQLTKHPDEASDLVQETYLKAIRSAARFEERGKGMRSWLFTILHNSFYTRVKRAGRAPQAVPDLFDAESRETAPDNAPPTWDLASLDWDQVDGRLKAAIDDLKPEHREVLLLWGVEGLKYREIANILGVPIGTVMSRLHRARKILADALEEFAAETGWLPAGEP
jgi:RNA polymerase sigma-70 factor (ECF subfamily)